MLSADSFWLEKVLDMSTSELPCFEKTSIQTGSRGEHFCYFPVNIVYIYIYYRPQHSIIVRLLIYFTCKSNVFEQNSGKN